eukprot:gene24247-biopygen20883
MLLPRNCTTAPLHHCTTGGRKCRPGRPCTRQAGSADGAGEPVGGGGHYSNDALCHCDGAVLDAVGRGVPWRSCWTNKKQVVLRGRVTLSAGLSSRTPHHQSTAGRGGRRCHRAAANCAAGTGAPECAAVRAPGFCLCDFACLFNETSYQRQVTALTAGRAGGWRPQRLSRPRSPGSNNTVRVQPAPVSSEFRNTTSVSMWCCSFSKVVWVRVWSLGRGACGEKSPIPPHPTAAPGRPAAVRHLQSIPNLSSPTVLAHSLYCSEEGNPVACVLFPGDVVAWSQGGLPNNGRAVSCHLLAKLLNMSSSLAKADCSQIGSWACHAWANQRRRLPVEESVFSIFYINAAGGPAELVESGIWQAEGVRGYRMFPSTVGRSPVRAACAAAEVAPPPPAGTLPECPSPPTPYNFLWRLQLRVHKAGLDFANLDAIRVEPGILPWVSGALGAWRACPAACRGGYRSSVAQQKNPFGENTADLSDGPMRQCSGAGRNESGRGPDTGRTMEFKETGAGIFSGTSIRHVDASRPQNTKPPETACSLSVQCSTCTWCM